MRNKQSEPLTVAIRILSLKDRTESEIREKLKKKGFNDRQIAETVEYLKKKGYIDDTKFIQRAEKIAEDRLLGEMGLKNYLLRKGIPEDKIEALPQIDEFSIALKLLERKKHLLKDLSPERRKTKIAGFLLRRGFSWDTVAKCIKREFIGDRESL